jgi:serine protein kinase
MIKLAEGYKARYSSGQADEMSLEEYLDLCRKDSGVYATAAERMLAAIGEPELIDTRLDQRLSRIFSNRLIKRYPAFAEFYGLEDAISQIVAFFRHAAQGLEEKKQILYLLGPVGGGKSSIAERLKQLMERRPIYALKGSPVNESPLGLFAPRNMAGCSSPSTEFPAAISPGSCPPGRSNACRSSAGISPSSASSGSNPPCCARRQSPRPNPATRTTKTSPHW